LVIIKWRLVSKNDFTALSQQFRQGLLCIIIIIIIIIIMVQRFHGLKQ